MLFLCVKGYIVAICAYLVTRFWLCDALCASLSLRNSKVRVVTVLGEVGKCKSTMDPVQEV